MSGEITDFADEVLGEFVDQITDEVFLLIESDHEYMHKYLRLVHKHGLDSVNQWIGRRVKARFKLDNEQARQDDPESVLIQSHQKFE
jgi:hypothetical protein